MDIRKNSLIKIAAISFLLTIFWSASAYAQPQVTGFSGSLSNGATLTITGSSFGVNGPNILIFDDFESGTNGANIKIGAGSATVGKWDRITDQSLPKYDNTFSVSGKMASKSDYTIGSGNGSTSAMFVDNINTIDVFLSFWFYLPTTSSFPCYSGGSCNWKLAWIYGIDTAHDDQVLPVGLPGGPTPPYNDWAISCNGCYNSTMNWFNFNMDRGKWYRVWTWIHGTSDASGHKDLWVMSKDDSLPVTKKVDWNGQVLNSGGQFQHLSVSAFARLCNDCSESAPRFDDVYLATGANARARIEIGDSATYNTCTNLTIATVTSWGDTSITATVRQGSFTNLNNAYLYVIDANGNVNTNGYLLSDGGGGGSGGNTGGNTGGSSGGDTSSSGGSGCGFVKDDDKGQGAKGEGLAVILLLVITLAGMALFKRRLSNIRLHKKERADI